MVAEKELLFWKNFKKLFPTREDFPKSDLYIKGPRPGVRLQHINIAGGENPKYIQNQLGHASFKITMDTYGHLMPEVNKEAGKGLDETLFGSKMVANTEEKNSC
jgi:integrase